RDARFSRAELYPRVADTLLNFPRPYAPHQYREDSVIACGVFQLEQTRSRKCKAIAEKREPHPTPSPVATNCASGIRSGQPHQSPSPALQAPSRPVVATVLITCKCYLIALPSPC